MNVARFSLTDTFAPVHAQYRNNSNTMMPSSTVQVPNQPSRDLSSERLQDSRDLQVQDVGAAQPMAQSKKLLPEWRCPSEEQQQKGEESRNPSSPCKPLSPHHERNLSAQFYEATTLDDPELVSSDLVVGQKHRRVLSQTEHQASAHRRINSIGNSVPRHRRVESGGLDILSAAVDVKDDRYGNPAMRYPLNDSRMQPPQPRGTYNGYHHLPMTTASYPPQYLPLQTQSFGPPQYYPTPAAAPVNSTNNYRLPTTFHQYPPQQQPQPAFYDAKKQQQPTSPTRPEWGTHQGSQTLLTTIAVGNGQRTMNPSKDDLVGQHHRKMSSMGSIGLLTGPMGPLYSPGGATTDQQHPLKKGHHRTTSSTVSFLHGIELESTSADDVFLRNLQASNAVAAAEPPKVPLMVSEKKLATSGASKRVRRKCTVEGCNNRVVQGGLCISHGAKRKTCKHPGCNKNVKKAGLCSTHGPARKRCEHEDCTKVAVQGGRCIAHGAKKRQCAVASCAKQAILAGMCKKHHDESKQTPGHTRGLSIFQDLSADAVQCILTDQQQQQPKAMFM